MATASQPVQLSDLFGSLRRHWHVAAITAILGLLVGVLASFAIPSTYDATATVSVNPMSSTPLTETVDASKAVSMATEAGIVTSTKVAAAAADALSSSFGLDADQVRSSTSVKSPEDSLILDISFAGDTAEEAAAGADAVAEAYLELRRSDATSEVERLVKAADEQLVTIRTQFLDPEYRSPIAQQALRIQADALGTTLAQLKSFDLNPGQVVGNAALPGGPSTPGPVLLGGIGLLLGLLIGIPLALVRKEEDSEIGGVDGLHAIGDQIVLDGTKDTNRADTWDIAAFMLKIPPEIETGRAFIIMVDSQRRTGRSITAGQELVDALSRRGRAARFVDAGAINEGKISRGWPTEKKRVSWAGEIVVIDTANLTSDANKVALATRSDSVLVARSTTDDAAALRRLAGLLKSKNVEIALTALFPPAMDSISLTH